jgi:hypothetical protein
MEEGGKLIYGNKDKSLEGYDKMKRLRCTDSPLQKVKGNKGQDLGPGRGCNGRVVCSFVPL